MSQTLSDLFLRLVFKAVLGLVCADTHNCAHGHVAESTSVLMYQQQPLQSAALFFS